MKVSDELKPSAICPQTRKQGFESRAAARRWLKTARGTGKVDASREYPCPHCGWWHVTRQEPRTRRKLIRSRRTA